MIAAIVLVFALTFAVSTPVTAAEGSLESCERLHVITANSDTNGTLVTYKNSQNGDVSFTTFQGDYLPPPSICGNDYTHCNIHITSNYDKTIRVVILPLGSGIGLVAYNYLHTSNMLVYREQFVLTQTFPSCTYVYFTQTREVLGFCLDESGSPPFMYSLRIGIRHDNLSLSIVKEHIVKVDVDFRTLSNFVFFNADQDSVNDCFNSEDSRVICLESGYILDHSVSGGQFSSENPHISTCSNISRLLRVRSCKLVAHCSGMVFIFKVGQDRPMLISNGNSEQVFVCPDLQFVKVRNGTLSLHAENRTQIGNLVSFPFKIIRRGDCLIVKQHVIFFATLIDGRSVLVNLTSSSYEELGQSEHAMRIPSRIKGQIGLVHNGSETLVYNLSLPCHQEPTVVPNNFILANVFSTRATDQCGCPVVPAPTMEIESTASPNSTVAPVGGENNQWGMMLLAVLLVVVLLVVVVVVVIAIIVKYRKYKQGHRTSELPLESQCTTELLLDPSKVDGLETPKLDSVSNGSKRSSPPRPESTLSANMSQGTDSSEHVHGQAPSLNSQSETISEATSVGPSITDDPHPQTQAAESDSHYALTHLLEESVTPKECSSPRNSTMSYQGSSAICLGGSSSHVLPSLHVPLAGNIVYYGRHHPNSSYQESSSAATESGSGGALTNCSPIEATQEDGQTYMAGPNSSLASGPPPLPEYVQNVSNEWNNRSNERDFRHLEDSIRSNGEPNNNAPQVQRQMSNH